MKGRFTTLDIVSVINELNSKLHGLRVNQVYDVDHKTYLIRFNTTGHNDTEATDDLAEEKVVLLLESGSRFHTTQYKWPKNPTPTGFTMKLRKHLKNKRLEHIKQLGVDRIIDIQFGSGEAAYHVILELYDRGNIIITDYSWTILNILRPRKTPAVNMDPTPENNKKPNPEDNEDVKFMVREIYPVHLAQTANDYPIPTLDEIQILLSKAKPNNDTLRKLFVPLTIFGPPLLEHCFIENGIPENIKVRNGKPGEEKIVVAANDVHKSLLLAESLFNTVKSNQTNPGIIIANEEKRVNPDQIKSKSADGDDRKTSTDGQQETIIQFKEFHPFRFNQHVNSKKQVMIDQETFDQAVDIFFSSIEGQKIDHKSLQAEKDALKKLDNVKKDHEKRLEQLASAQKSDEKKANLIEVNCDLVEAALAMIRSLLAKQLSWDAIAAKIKEMAAEGDPVASKIKGLNLKQNQFNIELTNPYENEDEEPAQVPKNEAVAPKPQVLAINIDLSSYANARNYYDKRKVAATKESKTIASSEKAFKSAEKKTMRQLKDVVVKTGIIKNRKVYWFEKFYWFISSENYLMIAGRDAQQNELIVKKYMKPGDIYVHADLHGASSVVVKNTYYEASSEGSGDTVFPPKTLEEAATFAVSCSSAWDAKISTKSWWVRPDQVSKTAPSGEYLTIGSFMIRGKKNYLPMTQLILGFGFLFKLADEESIARHADERSIKGKANAVVEEDQNPKDTEINVSDDDSDGSKDGDAEDDGQKFPDTKIRTISISSDQPQNEDDDIEIIKPPEPKKKQQFVFRTLKQQQKKAAKSGHPVKTAPPVPDARSREPSESETVQTESNSSQLKRRQKAKMKKIKEKYGDQDENERKMMMVLLGHPEADVGIGEKKKNFGHRKISKKDQRLMDLTERIEKIQTGSKKVDVEVASVDVPQTDSSDGNCISSVTEDEPNQPKVNQPKHKQKNNKSKDDDVPEYDPNEPMHVDDEDDDEDMDDTATGSKSKTSSHLRLLNSLTGIPQPEDNLLFCVPVVGPYSALSNYKFHVKVMPGGSRRGKAAKTTLNLFMNNKNISQREKDLLKSTKDLDISKNLPQGIKISTSSSSSLSAAHKSLKKAKK